MQCFESMALHVVIDASCCLVAVVSGSVARTADSMVWLAAGT